MKPTEAEIEQVVDDLVAECDEDFVGAWELVWLVRARKWVAEDEPTRPLSVEIAQRLLARPGITAGKIECDEKREGGVLVPWSLTPERALERFNKEWDALGREPMHTDEVAYFATRRFAEDAVFRSPS